MTQFWRIPWPAGGILTLEAVAIGMTHPAAVYHEALKNFGVIPLPVFMVAGIFFMAVYMTTTFLRVV